MNPAIQELDNDVADAFAERLEAQERAYRERKARRAFRSLTDAAGQLRARLAAHPDAIVQLSEKAVTVSLTRDRAVELTIRISFDHGGDMQQWYVVREHLVRREHCYEEIDRETVHEDLAEATRRMLLLVATR